MAGPAITKFSEAQQLVYWRDKNLTVIVWWLQGKAYCLTPCFLFGPKSVYQFWSSIGGGGSFAKMLRGAAARGQTAGWVSDTSPREGGAVLAGLLGQKALGVQL